MSVRVMSEVFARYPVGGGEMLLALAMADHASDDGSRVFPTVKMLADKTRQSERTVQRQIQNMLDMGWLILVGFGNGGRSCANEYRISHDWIKGVNLSPFKKGDIDDIKGDTTGKKGDIDDIKGDTVVTRKEPSITINNHQEPPAGVREKIQSSEFNEFWQAYPKKVGKAEAQKAFSKINPDEFVLQAMSDALDWQRMSDSWTKNNGQYIPNPATWLNGRRWEDEKPAALAVKKGFSLEAHVREQYEKQRSNDEKRQDLLG